MTSSIVGEWNIFVQRADMEKPELIGLKTFNADGTWKKDSEGGQWVQHEGMLFLNFTDPPTYPPGLIYTANVTKDTLSGIMGYAWVENPHRSQDAFTRSPAAGVWWGTRPGAPHAFADKDGAAETAKHDLLRGARNASGRAGCK